jgi:L-phenylalanine/L-methionine N-acetyltransferase
MTEITIRAIELNDWAALFALQQRPKVCQRMLKMQYQSAAEKWQLLEKCSLNVSRLVAIRSKSPFASRLVGAVALTQVTYSRHHISVMVHDDYHGQGIGSQLLGETIDLADRWLDIKRLELTVFVDNAPAVHLYQKFGFVIEGTLKKYVFRSGNYVDAYTMARIV